MPVKLVISYDIHGVLWFGPFDICRVRYFGIGTASILGALTSPSGGAVDTFGIGRFGIASVRYRNRCSRYTVRSGIPSLYRERQRGRDRGRERLMERESYR